MKPIAFFLCLLALLHYSAVAAKSNSQAIAELIIVGAWIVTLVLIEKAK